MIGILGPHRLAAAFAALTIGAGCGGPRQRAAAPIAPPMDSAPASRPEWLTVDSAARTVTISIEVTAPPGTPSALLNGYRNGEARVVVPVDWTVKWDWRSADSTARHSLVVMVEREKMPLEGGRPSLSNAMTRMVTEGLGAGQTDQTTFVADEAGWYWMLCGVPGHAIEGEWISLKVDREARMPRVEIHSKAS
ncbi:MAG: sulfocyanin-like copper-binding protein [Gemmatimonadales bacterium]